MFKYLGVSETKKEFKKIELDEVVKKIKTK